MARYVILREDRAFFRFDESTGDINAVVELNSGLASFAGSLEGASDATAVKQYFTSLHHSDPVTKDEQEPQWRTELTAKSDYLKLSIKKVIVEGLETKPVTLKLESTTQKFSLFTWSAELAGRAEQLAQSLNDSTSKLAQRSKEIEEMVESVAAQRETYVTKVCAILDQTSRRPRNEPEEPHIKEELVDSDATADTE